MEHEDVLIISDTHVGSAFGLMPEGFLSSTGIRLPLNMGQEYLLECWQHFLNALPPLFAFLIINGDAPEGQNPAEEARLLSEVDPVWQVDAAEMLYRPLVERVTRGVFMTSGSRYHVGVGATFENVLARRLGARPNRAGRRVRPWLHLHVNGRLIEAAHRQSYTIVNRAMPLEREIRYAKVRCADQGKPIPDAIVRSHTHVGFRLWVEDEWMAMSTPGWKLQDHYAQTSISPNRMLPAKIGAVLLRVWHQPVGGYKLWPIPFLYEHPPPEIEGVEHG